MVDPVSGSGGITPVKNVSKAVAKPSEVEVARDVDAVEISDEAVALVQAVEARGQLADASDVVLSDSAQGVEKLL
ncbi:MAG: hypothetical protein ACRBCT_09705 [Alphaproteobacteria bacterium]